MFDLSGRTAIVTGAGGGLGAACAEAMAEAGADVVLADIDTGGLARTAASIEALGRRALPVACNIADEGAVDAMVAEAVGTFGSVEILINNAGIGDPAFAGPPVSDRPVEQGCCDQPQRPVFLRAGCSRAHGAGRTR
jgi:NAD(P)-dependent dehydrogenase (short-subunit alcohol dehydrogenase family)